MVGKSAHGRNGKLGYYEHAWATIKGSYVPGLKRQCAPYRVLAKQLEPAVWDKVWKVIMDDNYAQEVLREARQNHERNPGSRELEKQNQTVFSVEQQIERLSARLATLPDTIDATPIYRQMEKLQDMKKAAEEKRNALKSSGCIKDPPADLKTYTAFREYMRNMLLQNDSPKTRAQILRSVVRKILITPEGATVKMQTGSTFIKIYLNQFCENDGGAPEEFDQALNKKRAMDQALSPTNPKKLGVGGSNTCQIGRGGGI